MLTKRPKLQLGIFLCIRCASLHRKLGTHISKVKSISMDSWNNDQVDVGLPSRPLSMPQSARRARARAGAPG